MSLAGVVLDNDHGQDSLNRDEQERTTSKQARAYAWHITLAYYDVSVYVFKQRRFDVTRTYIFGALRAH